MDFPADRLLRPADVVEYEESPVLDVLLGAPSLNRDDGILGAEALRRPNGEPELSVNHGDVVSPMPVR